MEPEQTPFKNPNRGECASSDQIQNQNRNFKSSRERPPWMQRKWNLEVSGEREREKMDRSCTPSRLVLLFVLTCLLIATEAAATTSIGVNRRPGFLYTRTRGKCSPQYWSSRSEEWPRMLPQTSTVTNVFGSRAYERYRSDLTILEATSRNDDVENVFAALLKQGSTALLNSYTRTGFGYSPWEVKTMVIQGLVSKEIASVQAKQFSIANEACN